MTGAGRPLRFLTIVMGGWIGARVVMLWPAGPVAAVEHAILPRAVAGPSVGVRRPTIVRAAPTLAAIQARIGSPTVALATPMPAQSHLPSPDTPHHAIAIQAETTQPGILPGLPLAPAAPPARGRSRLFGSAWALARGGNGTTGIAGAQLGGSQAGMRIAYALRDDRRLALAARFSAPLGKGMRELALGVEWQPTRLPVRLVAEQRFALNRGRGGPTLMAVGGLGPLPIAAGFRLESYAQGGVIARDGAEGFADGAVRLARPVATVGGVRIDLGGGGWGAAQKGAARLDIGPSLSATVPLGPQPVRLSLDWRQRVAGNATPGSGLVVTLGADF